MFFEISLSLQDCRITDDFTLQRGMGIDVVHFEDHARFSRHAILRFNRVATSAFCVTNLFDVTQQHLRQPRHLNHFRHVRRGDSDSEESMDGLKCLMRPDQSSDSGRAEVTDSRQVEHDGMRAASHRLVNRFVEVTGPIIVESSNDSHLNEITVVFSGYLHV